MAPILFPCSGKISVNDLVVCIVINSVTVSSDNVTLGATKQSLHPFVFSSSNTFYFSHCIIKLSGSRIDSRRKKKAEPRRPSPVKRSRTFIVQLSPPGVSTRHKAHYLCIIDDSLIRYT